MNEVKLIIVQAKDQYPGRFYSTLLMWYFFFLFGFSFTIRRTAGEGGGYFFNFSLPLPLTSQTFGHYPGHYCRELTSTHS